MISLFSNTNFTSSDLQTKKPVVNYINTLYSRHHDEPDFDCEFLKYDSIDTRGSEDILDPDPDEYADYNNKKWETDLYDPYVQQSYY